jgi:threonine-phosphate decarboxylase
MRIEDSVRKHLSDLNGAVHGGQGWRYGGVEDFSHNLNPLGPPDILNNVIISATSNIGHYPDDSCADLKKVIAKRHSLSECNVMVGAGSSDIIRAFPNTFVEPGDKVVIARPTFAEYGRQCRVAGANITDLLLTESDDFRINRDRLSKLIPGAKALFICNPNNPTGRVESRERILSIAEECLKKNVMLFLDETLLDLVLGHEDISCAGYIDEYPNMVVACSLTKSFAIPGVRIGYGLASEGTVKQMEKVRMAWNVGGIEQHVAKILIRDHMSHVDKAARMMDAEKRWMFNALKDIGFPVSDPADSFFYFCPTSSLGIDAPTFTDRMMDSRILVRDCSSFGRPFDGYVRFCVKDRIRNTAFVQAAHDALRSLGW